MKRIIITTTLLLWVLLGPAIVFAQTQRWVSPSGTGDGTTAAVPMSLDALRTALATNAGSLWTTTNLVVYFEAGTYPMSAAITMPATLTRVKFTATSPSELSLPTFNATSLRNFLTVTARNPAATATSITVEYLKFSGFSGSGSNGTLFLLGSATQNTNTTLTLDHVIIENCTSTGTGDYLLGATGGSATGKKVYVRNSTIRNCTVTGRIFEITGAGANNYLEVSYCSIYSNSAGSYLMYLVSATTVYNTTFSNNTLSGGTATQSIYINNAATNHVKLVNNTMYRSGGLNPNTNRKTTAIVNNIIIHTDTDGTNALAAVVANTGNTDVGFRANVMSTAVTGSITTGIYFRPSKITAGTDVSIPFGYYFDTNPATALPANQGPGRQVHPLDAEHLDDLGLAWDIHSGTNVSGIIPFTDDQLGNTRPAPFAIGASDADYMKLRVAPPIYITYPPVPPAITRIDLSHLFQNKMAGVPVEYTLLGSTVIPSTLGTLTGPAPGSDIVTFTPDQFTPTPGRAMYKYEITQNRPDGGTYQGIDSLEVVVLDATQVRVKAEDLPGYVDPSLNTTCYDYMGAVTFVPAYRFITSWSGSNEATNRPAGYIGPRLNSYTDYLHGFSIPLVADLDGDGFPEVICTSQNGDGGSGHYNGFHIYNGRTGKRLAYYTFLTSGDNIDYGGSHGAPSPMALVDSDRDGIVELIMAFPNGSNSPYSARRLMSYTLTPVKSGSVTTGYTVAQNPKWPSASTALTQYSSSTNHEKVIPTVVDINGDGVPEVVAYNNIYNAETGAWLFRYDTDADAFKGMDSGAGAAADAYIGFNYVYDLDLDGTYDVAAGGKVYRITATASPTPVFTTEIITAPGTPTVADGRTGVADINGDRIPDVVTTHRSSGNIRIVVWNPGFFKMDIYGPDGKPELDGSGNFIRNATPNPYIMADVTYAHAAGGYGSNSTVHIGDIDGREQNGMLLPEIAILAGASNAALSVHPNVAGTSFAGTTLALIAVTWDLTPGTAAGQRLKQSFKLEHEDDSRNTGFTMFDFDNDGLQEICYRDMESLRIIKAAEPLVSLSYDETNRPDIILFKSAVYSYTGFEFPVIADIDNDVSAEIAVLGYSTNNNYYYSYLYAVGNGAGGDKFAPALPVWNQAMYDPFKINTDLTTRTGPAPNRLDPAYYLRKEIKDEAGKVSKVIENVNPFNGTLLQATKFDGSVIPKFEPIIYLTEAYLCNSADNVTANRPSIIQIGTKYYIEMTIGNHASAQTSVSSNTPVAIYIKNTITEATRDTTFTLAELLNNLPSLDVLGTSFAIDPGELETVRIPVDDPDEVYIVRLGDSSDETGWHFGYNGGASGSAPCTADGFSTIGNTGIAARAFRDCDWCDQTIRVAKPALFPDLYTVQEFKSVEMNILANDIIPDVARTSPPEPPFLSTLVLTAAHIQTPPRAGYLTFNGASGVGNRVTYYHTDSVPLPAAIDSFQYKLTFWNPETNAVETKYAWVHIYVLESAMYGFSACYNEVAHIEIRDLPEGVGFEWYGTKTSSELIESGRTHNTAAMQGDSTYWLKPVLVGVADERYQTFDFPRGELTVSLATRSPNATATMQWTGLFSTNWRDSRNWVEVKTENGSDYTTPVQWPPNTCVDVIIPSNTEYYPELIDAVACRNITVKDRAMLKNPHVLVYDSARVEIKLKPSERDRFVMWSAPLMNTYSGDYHFKDAGSGQPRWGDVYMNYFQQAHPDGGIAAPLVFTSTFGQLAEPLGLGKAFNLKVTSTTATKDQLLVFPQTTTVYTADNATTYPTSRTADAGKFITYGQDPYQRSDTMFAMPVAGPNAGFSLIQVVNPYMAYLSFAQFRAGNTSNINDGYYIWNGNLNAGFTVINMNGNRYSITEPSLGVSPDLIPPLQSFLVKKSTPGAEVAALWMSPNWTTTTAPFLPSYILRAAPVASDANTLRIKASQGAKTSYAILVYDQNASPDLGREDMPVLIYDEIPLTLYSYTALHEPLAIHTSGDFRSQVDLGLRVRDAGETKLEFTGLSGFGHDVYLIDKEKNLEIDLQQQPEYTFVVTKAANSVVELNSRFSLRMEYTGNGLTTANQPVVATELIVTALDGTIHIRSTSGRIRDLQVYNMNGGLIYGSRTEAESFRIPVARGEVYIIRAQTDSRTSYEIRKVWVK